VALFPFSDHNACPVKLMLEFCVDISLYLLENQENKGLVHCKAGKGRTGVMICAYLIFSGLCKNTKEAIEVYGERRSHIKKVNKCIEIGCNDS
jgi:phosphatidylinositol-3,4,5-trisphosphate 3-phosphatase/dual-specificity protein phosphatase PTEN